MSFGRKSCSFCSNRFYSDGKVMEVCYSFALKAWCCLSRYLKKVAGTDETEISEVSTSA